MAGIKSVNAATGTLNTWDGVSLAYSQSGPIDGPNVLLICGWCQTAAQWKKQYDALSKSFRVTTYDHRGHGESEKTDRGFRISRLAADLNDLIVELDLRDVVLVGHSMGCSVVWSYWDLFQDSRTRIRGLVLADQPPYMTSAPTWMKQEGEDLGSVFTRQQPYDIADALQGEQRKGFVESLLSGMLTETVAKEDLEWMVGRNMLINSVSAASLALEHAKNDWRDVIRTINKPTLVIGATGSMCPLAASEWTAGHVVGAKLVTIRAEEGGSHFMFWENATKFNAAVESFVKSLERKN